MSRRRDRSPRLWPLIAVAALLWTAIPLSAHWPVLLRPTENTYLSAQRGCVGGWWWRPANRTSLGLRDTLSIRPGEDEPLAYRPFLWRDPWGFGVGLPLWLPAAVVTIVAARRYAVTSVRGAPAALQSRRRAAVVVVLTCGSVCLALAVSANHRSEPLFTLAEKQLRLQNGSIVLERLEDARPISTTGSTFVVNSSGTLIVSPGTVLTSGGTLIYGSAFAQPGPSRGPLPIDLVPGAHLGATGWRFTFPLWMLVAVAAWLAFRAVRAARYRGPGLCSACGYDLRGLSGTAACPECGTAVAVGTAESRPA